jgi:hypothetical protein
MPKCQVVYRIGSLGYVDSKVEAGMHLLLVQGLVLESHVTDGLLKKATIQLSLFRSVGAMNTLKFELFLI